MRRLLAAWAAFGLVIALGAGAMAGDDKTGKDAKTEHVQTIHGVIGGITAEGDLEVNYQTKQAVMVETAYLTVIGSPSRGNASSSSSGSSSSTRSGSGSSSGRHRHNVYVAVISPRTKVYKAVDDSGKATDRKEASLDALEVGDHVELQFQPGDESEANSGTKQSAKMRTRHGRHRTHFGVAMSVVIEPSRHEHSTSSSSGSSGDSSPSKDKDRSR